VLDHHSRKPDEFLPDFEYHNEKYTFGYDSEVKHSDDVNNDRLVLSDKHKGMFSSFELRCGMFRCFGLVGPVHH